MKKEQIEKSYEIISALNSGMKGFNDLWNNTDAFDRKCIVEMIGRTMKAQSKQGEGEEDPDYNPEGFHHETGVNEE